MKNRLRLFRVAGIPIEVDVSWLVIFALVVFTLAIEFFPEAVPGIPRTDAWLLGVISALLLFSSLLCHELSHSIVAQRSGIPIRRIVLFLFGGVAEMTAEPPSAFAEFKMAAAGPLCSILLAGIFGFSAWHLNKSGGHPYLLAVLLYLAMVNGFLALLNLLPGFPLDGGRILRSLLWRFTRNLEKATYFASLGGKGIAFLLLLAGVVRCLPRGILPFFPEYGGDLLGGFWMMLIAAFLWDAARAGYANSLMRSSLEGVPVQSILHTNLIPVEESMTMAELLQNYFLIHHTEVFPVFREGAFTGFVSMEDFNRIPRDLWLSTAVGDIVRKDSLRFSVSLDDDLMNAMGIMLQTNRTYLPVRHDSRVLGVIYRRDINRLITPAGKAP
ncbi:MAG: site-2 protease family protein [bacterium]